MGNQPSSRLRGPPRIRADAPNALGLSKSELDERCKPSGLYSTCNWDEKTIRRLIGDGKLASRPPSEETDGHHECPICFFHYPQINVTVCCQASICTECYLQLQPYQKPNSSSTALKPAKTQLNVCPFCNAPKLSVTVAQRKAPPPPPVVIPEAPESNPANAPPSPTTGFGSSLAQNPRVAMMRARSCSVASSSNDDTTNETACMTPQERHVLEDEMRAQHLHPLALRLEQEEAERRLRNELEYAARRPRGPSSSLHHRQPRPPPPLALPGLTEEQQMALAIAASLQETARAPVET